MFQHLSDRLKSTFEKLTGRGVLSEEHVTTALRDVRIALLEADVALPAVKKFMALAKERAVGEEVTKSIKPVDQVIKIVNDCLVELLGEGEDLNLQTKPPAVILMCGLQGGGKTTSTGKLAKYLKDRQQKKVLLASLDIYRPAAQEQLTTLAGHAGVDALEIIPRQKPLDITKRALKEAQIGGYDVLFLDTAGRTELDDTLMAELQDIKKLAHPHESLLVADSLTGQTAVNIADAFHKNIALTGIILTRMDGDGRGGAALSMREVTGCPIKYVGLGEGIDALEPFRPEGVASRILGMGDVVGLVEKAQQAMEGEDTAALEERLMSGQFDMADMRNQFKMMMKMGGMSSMFKLMPGMGKLKDKVDASKLDDKMMIHQIAIIDSMTRQERKNPAILNAKRRKRIAAGCGLSVHEVNKLVKNWQQMNKMMKMLKGGGMAGLMKKLMG